MDSRYKVSVIGAGNIGSTIAHLLTDSELADVVMVDVVDGLPQGKALDLFHASAVGGTDMDALGCNTYEETAGSDVIVITAGMVRKPGMSRDDLLLTNARIMKDVAKSSAEHSPDAKIIVVSNPLDVMAYTAFKVSGFAKNRVMGMAGVLDSARFAAFAAKAMNVSVSDVTAMVLGGHGDTMLPLVRYCTVGGIPITHFLENDKIDDIIKRTRFAGGEIVSILKTSAYYSPATSVVSMVKAILLDKRKVLSCSALLEGEYGLDGVYLGVPVILGRNGVEKIIEVELDDSEREVLATNASSIKSLIEKVFDQ